jgi:choline dehydrogenase
MTVDARKRYDYVIVGGGSAGCAIANRLSADPSSSVLVLEAGRSDYIIDPFIHMPAALPIPIGNRLYDWKYETDPEPYMNDRKVFHARGKILGGSSSINGMIFQRGNPMDYQRWAADPGMESWDYLHCLPYFKRMESLILDDGRVGADELARRQRAAPGRARVGGEPVVRRVLRGRAAGGLPADRRRQRLPAGGLRAVRPQHPPRPPLVRGRAYLLPVRNRKNLDVETSCVRDRGSASTAPVRRRRVHPRRPPPPQRGCRRGDPLRRRDQHPPAAPALRGRRRGTAREARRAGRPHLPGVGENLQDHLEVYIQYASKLPVSIAPGLRYRSRPGIGYKWLFHRSGLGATNHFEGGGFARSNDDVDCPNLMFHFLPIAIRYDGTARRTSRPVPRLPGAHRPDVRRHPRLGADPLHRPPPAPVHAVQLPVDADRPQGMGRGDPGGPRHPQPAGVRTVQRRRAVARPVGRDRPGDPRLGRQGTPRPPSTRHARRRWARARWR